MERTNYEAWRAGLAADLDRFWTWHDFSWISQQEQRSIGLLVFSYPFADLLRCQITFREAPDTWQGIRDLGLCPSCRLRNWPQWTSLTIGSCWVPAGFLGADHVDRSRIFVLTCPDPIFLGCKLAFKASLTSHLFRAQASRASLV